jgi:hypothetical protein
VAPAPGWRVSLTDLGLPAPPNGTRVANDERPFQSAPLVGSIGATAYFIAGSPGTPGAQWWLVAVDTQQGRPAFAAVPLDRDARAPECFINGPDSVLCLRDDPQRSTAWVIDARSGALTYTGPTDLRTAPSTLTVGQVGAHAVASTQHQGVYGIGPRAETTWFVPGEGTLDELYMPEGGGARSTLLTQTVRRQRSLTDVLFSSRSGAVLVPQTNDGDEVHDVIVYPGGFAARIVSSDRDSRVEFFDETGRRVGAQIEDASLIPDALDLPVIRTLTDEWAVYSTTGDLLLELPGPVPVATRLVGSTLFTKVDEPSTDINEPMIDKWQQYDLRTGAQGKSCAFDMGADYLGSDGTVGVFEKGNPAVGLTTEAHDLATCDKLWSIASPAGSLRDVWQVGTTLVQLSDDGKELMSLVSPR